MIAWINLFVLMFSSLLFVLFYNMSVSPAFFEDQWGERAYKICGRLRLVAMAFMGLACADYIVFCFYPLPLEGVLPLHFPWARGISVVIAVLIGIPALALMVRGMIDAGSELAVPDRSHVMYQGIYKKIRHPQAAGEVFLFMVIALACHSPFLALYSLWWFPAFYLISLAEEKDLVLRYKEDYVRYRNEVGMFWPRKRKTGM